MKQKWLFAILPALCFCAAAAFCFHLQKGDIISVYSPAWEPTIILDAGHGGEDGGAVAADGTKEKDVNLRITGTIAPLLDWFGLRYVSVRTEDRLIGDNSLPTIRERKVSDIRKRMQIVSDTPEAILLSIHQNYYVSERYCGTQVFYAPDAPDSAALAECIQRSVCGALQPENTRKIKPTEGTVYLLDKAVKTSVMVECGFLSNQAESKKLQDHVYQLQISYFIVRGVCDFINNRF